MLESPHIALFFIRYPGCAVERPAIVSRIYKIKVVKHVNGKGTFVSHWVAQGDWFKEHKEKNYFSYNCQTKVWNTEFEQDLVNNFVPIKFAGRRYICCKKNKT